MRISQYILVSLVFGTLGSVLLGQANPFLRPGSQSARPPAVIKPAPPPPPPKPLNTNLELRGFFKFDGQWYFSIFDKVKNQGVWLQKGERFDDGKVEIESFNEETEIVKMKNGLTLSLKKSDNKVLPVPSAMPVKKPAPTGKKPPVPTRTNIAKPATGGRTLTIPPRTPSIPQRPK
ncbi:MAG: hypothetical protein VX479_01040 [Verrucomicrobiota bacterium]|jgi:hypothetical protein|nr:hypothetical protein [Verrucomicrobiota bacterium]|tara:strand:+ start:2794 stop:3321 length:528 start_codon:yes stop_codon:yes gene_type:complete